MINQNSSWCDLIMLQYRFYITDNNTSLAVISVGIDRRRGTNVGGLELLYQRQRTSFEGPTSEDQCGRTGVKVITAS